MFYHQMVMVQRTRCDYVDIPTQIVWVKS